jgi:hypothetical protein
MLTMSLKNDQRLSKCMYYIMPHFLIGKAENDFIFHMYIYTPFTCDKRLLKFKHTKKLRDLINQIKFILRVFFNNVINQ